jgi:hypothetical protein
MIEQNRYDARQFVDRKAEQIEAEGGKGKDAQLVFSKPDQEIVKLGKELEAGLIVVGSRGLGGVDGTLMGSVSDSVVRHAHGPVLVVRGGNRQGRRSTERQAFPRRRSNVFRWARSFAGLNRTLPAYHHLSACFYPRTTSTGQRACRTTESETLPMSALSNLLKPRLPITTRLASSSSPEATISWSGLPTATWVPGTSTPSVTMRLACSSTHDRARRLARARLASHSQASGPG